MDGARDLFSRRADSYARFIRFVRYPQGHLSLWGHIVEASR